MSVISRQFTLEASYRAAHTGSCAFYFTGHALSCTFGEGKGPPAVGSGSNSNGPVIRSHKPCLPSNGRSGPVIPSLASKVAKTPLRVANEVAAPFQRESSPARVLRIGMF